MMRSLFSLTTTALLLFLTHLPSARSFVPPPTAITITTTTTTTATITSSPKDPFALFGLAEWRDLDYEFPGTGDDRRLGKEQGGLPKSVCILPFPYTDVLLQGETKQLRLYEDRFVQLFQDAVDNDCGVVAMGLIADSGIIQTVPICEIEAFNRMDQFGIFVTIRVVARAQLLQITKQEPYLKAACLEINDKIPPNLELPCLVAANIENFMLLLSSMEHRLDAARQEKSVTGDDDDDDDATAEEDSDMRRRINIAKLEDRFYQNDDNDDDDNDDDDDDNDNEYDRRKRFRHAYEVALATDTQGYCVTGNDIATERSPQELSAVSWASFCTGLLAAEEATFRIQALDCDNLFDRLKLASHMLRAKKQELRSKMEKAGLKFRAEDMEGEAGDEPFL